VGRSASARVTHTYDVRGLTSLTYLHLLRLSFSCNQSSTSKIITISTIGSSRSLLLIFLLLLVTDYT